MNRQEKIFPARHSSYRLAHWLLAACLLTAAAFLSTTADAQTTTPDGLVTFLATNQFGAGYIIVDGSRVYWINFNNSEVSSVDKLFGIVVGADGAIRIHNPANNSAPGGAIVQDDLNIYFASETGTQGFSYWNLFSATKFSAFRNVTQLTFDTNDIETSTSGSGPALGLNGLLYYLGGFENINCPGDPNYDPNSPDNCNVNRTIKKISTQGGTPAQVIPLASNPTLNIGPDYFDTDSVYLHWSDEVLNAILRVPLVGGLSYSVDALAPNIPGTLSTPTTGPAGGYHFWIEGFDPNAVLREQTPGGQPFTLLTGALSIGYNSFVQVGSFVYCATFNGIVRVPITGGTPTVVVDPLDSLVPAGLTSDGTYLYWTAAGDGSIRRVPLPPDVDAVVTTGRASNITRSSAILNGTVNPNGLTTTVYFQYGRTTNYGFFTANRTYTGNTTQSVSLRIPRLRANTKYHFRLVETNNGVTTYGSDMTFKTRR
jgi:hypothetical protein